MKQKGIKKLFNIVKENNTLELREINRLKKLVFFENASDKK